MVNSANALFGCALLSIVSCSIVVILIFFDPTHRTSKLLALVKRLLISGIGLNAALLIYTSVSRFALSGSSLNRFCNIFFPFPIFFFIASYGWTILIAFRFQTSNSWFLPSVQSNATTAVKESSRYWMVWVISFLLLVPVICFNIANQGEVTFVIDQSAAHLCVYNHSTLAGKIVDLATLQVPLGATILINMNSYFKGLLALRDSPHSVLARQMKRAGGYLAVLIVVWAPNIAYNLYSISASTNSKFNSYLDFTFCLAALQGFLNVVVYVLSNPALSKWMYEVLTCQKPWEEARSSLWARNSLDSSSQADPSSTSATTNALSGAAADGGSGLTGPLMTQQFTADSLSTRESFSVEAGQAPAPAPAPKGILQKKKSGRSWATSNLDQDRFVRFGQSSTRFISTSERSSQGGMRDSLAAMDNSTFSE